MIGRSIYCRNSLIFTTIISLLLSTSKCSIATVTQVVVKTIEDAYINGTTYHGEAKAVVNYADTWSVCPAWSNFITATDFTANATFDAQGNEDISFDLSTLAGPGIHADFAFVGFNFFNSSQTLCSGFYCIIIYGPKQNVKVQIAGYEKKETFNLSIPLRTYRKLFNEGRVGSRGPINWRFIQCPQV